MPVCAAAVGALATFYQQPETEQSIHDTVTRLIAKMPTIAAYSYKHSLGQPFMYPRNTLDYCSNFLHMMFATPCEEYEVDPVLAKAVDLLLILHADHEQNCSTSTVRVVGQLAREPVREHRGRHQRALGPAPRRRQPAGDRDARRASRPRAATCSAFVDRAKDKKDNSRLMGFGHRVYKNYDPRAAILKKACADVLSTKLGLKSRQLEIAMKLEEIALKRRLLHQPQAVSERRLLLGHHLQGARHPGEHVHGDVHARPPARLDRAVDRDAARSGHPHRPAAADLHGRDGAGVRASGGAQVVQEARMCARMAAARPASSLVPVTR